MWNNRIKENPRSDLSGDELWCIGLYMTFSGGLRLVAIIDNGRKKPRLYPAGVIGLVADFK